MQFTLTPKQRVLRKITLPAAAMGAGDMSSCSIVVDKTFVPGAGEHRRQQGSARARRPRVPRRTSIRDDARSA